MADKRLTGKDEQGYYAPRDITLNCLKQRGELTDRLAYYEDLEERGRLVVLPCMVGDTVWFLPQYGGKPLGMIREDKVQMIGVTSRGFHLKLRNNHDHNKMYMLGKTVFLTKEEAKKALEGREDNATNKC